MILFYLCIWVMNCQFQIPLSQCVEKSKTGSFQLCALGYFPLPDYPPSRKLAVGNFQVLGSPPPPLTKKSWKAGSSSEVKVCTERLILYLEVVFDATKSMKTPCVHTFAKLRIQANISTFVAHRDRTDRADRPEGGLRGRGRGRGGRGGRGRGGFDRFGKREFDRHSGSEKTQVLQLN